MDDVSEGSRLTREQVLAANEGVNAWDGRETYMPAPAKVEAVIRKAQPVVHQAPEMPMSQKIALLQGKAAQVAPAHHKAARLLYAIGVTSRAKVAAEVRSAPRAAIACETQRGHERRQATNRRQRGSRRSSTSTSSSCADPPDDPESDAAELRLWRHPRWGRSSGRMLRVLLRGEQER